MRSVRSSRTMQLVAAVVGLALAGCNGGSSSTPAKAYEGRWTMSGMGTVVLNLRSDGAFSRSYTNGNVGDPVVWAEKGTYTFMPKTAGDDTAGTMELTATHDYNTTTDTWEPVMSMPTPEDFIVHAGPPRTLEFVGLDTFTYYGPQAEIPATL